MARMQVHAQPFRNDGSRALPVIGYASTINRELRRVAAARGEVPYAFAVLYRAGVQGIEGALVPIGAAIQVRRSSWSSRIAAGA